MPDTHGELVFSRTVVDRQIDVYLRDLDRSHDPVAGIQKTLVFGVLGCLGVGLAGSLAAAVGDVEWIDRLAQDRLTAGRQLGVVFRGGTQLVARLGEGPSVDLFAHLLALRSQFTARLPLQGQRIRAEQQTAADQQYREHGKYLRYAS